MNSLHQLPAVQHQPQRVWPQL